MSNRVTKLLTAAILIGAPASALASPRTLASGAPACGNTMGKGKSYGPSECAAEDFEIDEPPTVRTVVTPKAIQKGAERAARVVKNMLDGTLQVKPAPGKPQPMSTVPAIEVALLTIEALPRPQS